MKKLLARRRTPRDSRLTILFGVGIVAFSIGLTGCGGGSEHPAPGQARAFWPTRSLGPQRLARSRL